MGVRRCAVLYAALLLFLSCSIWPAHAEDDTRVVLVDPGGVPEQVLALYNKFVDHRGGLPTAGRGRLSENDLKTAAELMRTLYVWAAQSGDAHGTVALLIKQGLAPDTLSQDFKDKKYKQTQIDEGASRLMAAAREQMIESAVLEVLAKRPDLHVARSDTGNPDSGMRSDLDQTFFAFRVDPKTGAKTRAPELDDVFLKDFHAVWEARHGDLTLKMLDVVSLKGSARFPDPRFVSVESFASAFHRAAGDLRNLEGAYISPEAITQQVHQRQHKALTNLLERPPPDTADPPRMWQEYGRNGEAPDKLPKPDFDLAVREMLGGTPELAPYASFSAAIANWMMLRHSVKGVDFNVKYHLRTFDDSVYVKLLLEAGGGMRDRAEYSNMTAKQRELIARDALGQLFPNDSAKQKLHKAAMDVSADLRNRHTQAGGGRPEPSRPELAGADDRTIYEPLLREMFGDRYTPQVDTPQARARLQVQIEAAKACHQRLASELCIRSAQFSAPDAFRAMRDGAFCDQARPFFEIAGRPWEEVRGNLMEGARLTLLYGIHDLGMVEGARLLRQMDLEVPGSNRWDLAKLYLDAQFMPFRAYRANPQAYHEAFRVRVADLADGAKSYTLGQWGFERVADFEAGSTILKEQKLVWNKYKLMKNMFADAGTVASLAAVAETFVLTKGDMKEVTLKALDEVFLAVPVVGQVENVRRGGLQSAVLIGAALYFPPLGKALIVYNIGQSMYVIADAEYLAPARNNAADLVYRGFAGPETRAYGEPGDPPPVWYEEMEKEHQDKKARFAGAQETLKALEQIEIPPDAPPERQVEHKVALAQARIDLAASKAEWEEVERMKEAFKQLSEGHWAGGYFTEGGAVKDQIWIPDPLLERIEPLYGFITGGVVDLRVDYDPARDEPLLKQLAGEAKSASTVEQQVRAASRLAELRLRKDRYERARRYKAKFEKQPELLARFRRDSVYANVQEKRIDMDTLVRDYFGRHDKRLYEKLLETNLIGPASPPAVRIGREPFHIDTDVHKVVPGSVKTVVRERLQEDYERSQRLLAAYKRSEQHRLQEQERQTEQAVLLFQNQAFAEALKPFGNDQDFLRFLSALRLAGVKRAAPNVRMTFFKIVSNGTEGRTGKEGAPLREPFHVDVQANLEVDSSLHKPPYTTSVLVLTEEAARNPPGKTGNVPLLPETAAAIRAAAKPDHVVAVGSVSCDRVAPLDAMLAKTVEGLPGYADGKAATGSVVLHQAVKAIPVKPFSVTVDPIRVEVVDAAGNPIAGVQGLVRVGDAPAQVSRSEYWGKHIFTRYGEKVPITATYRLPEDKTLTGSSALSIDEIADWLKPAGPPEPIRIRLPILLPSSVSVRGRIRVEKLPQAATVSESASLRSGGLKVDTRVDFPVGRTETTFEVKSRRPLVPGETVRLEASTGGTVRLPGNESAEGKRYVLYSGSLAVTIPGTGGVIDAGVLVLRADLGTVTVPSFDPQNPPLAKDYIERVKAAGLIPKPTISGQPPRANLAHCVEDTLPKGGTTVLPGTDVGILLYGASEFTVPDVVGLKLPDATAILEKKQIRPKPWEVGSPPRAEEEFRVIRQGIAPGTPYEPDSELSLTVYGPATPVVRTVVVPDLSGLTVSQAVLALQKVDLKLKPAEKHPPAPDLGKEGTIGRQTPVKDDQVQAGGYVTAWVYGKFERGGEAESVAEVTGPFFVVFGLLFPDLKQGQGIPPAPKKGERESKEAFAVRLRRYLDGISYKDLSFAPVPPEKMVMPFYIANAGLGRYPRRLFTPDAKFAVSLEFTNLKPQPNQPNRLQGALLLQVLRVCDTREQVVAAYPRIKENKDLNALAFQTADGICQVSTEAHRSSIGPLRPGWSDADKQACWNLLKEIYIAIGSISCFVATVSYPDLDAPRFRELRDFRDRVLVKSEGGRRLVDLYYRHGPALASAVIEHGWESQARVLLDLLAQVCNRLEPSDPLVQIALRVAERLVPVAGKVFDDRRVRDPLALPSDVLIRRLKGAE